MTTQKLGATGILLIGNHGTGKSSSFETLPPEQTLIVQPNTKDLPWGGWERNYEIGRNLIRVQGLNSAISEAGQAYQAMPTKPKYIIIEDTTHLQTQRTTSASFIAQSDGGKSYAKWNQFGADFGRLIIDIPKVLPAGTFVIFVGHVELKDDGVYDIQTAGKLLDNNIKIPSWFTYALHSRVIKESDKLKYVFQTNFDGVYSAKTPRGCFTDLYIPNDMKAVCDRIEQYKSS